MHEGARVLVVDDHPDMAALLADQLSDEGYGVDVASSGSEALARAKGDLPDLVVTDLRMDGMDGIELLGALKELDSGLPVILTTAFGEVETAVEAMRKGASAYVTKPYALSELLVEVERALEHRALKDEVEALRSLVWPVGGHGMVFRSDAMRQMLEHVARAAQADFPVLIRGETGTGKELVARALHFGGRRRDGPYVALNCAAVPAHLLQSELFGHVKGSFTGATAPRRGLMLQAHEGTLFLDEIGDMPLELQSHLLRAIEGGEVRPVGADVPRRVDVRIVAATHQALEEAVRQGTFRADLLFRLDVLPIHVPPLRDRTGDVPLLVAHFLNRLQPTTPLRRLDDEALAVLERYPWPGNVRELENLVARLAVLAEGEVIGLEALRRSAPNLFRPDAESLLDTAESPRPLTLREVEEGYIDRVLGACGGNKTRAAEILGVDPSTLHRRLSKR